MLPEDFSSVEDIAFEFGRELDREDLKGTRSAPGAAPRLVRRREASGPRDGERHLYRRSFRSKSHLPYLDVLEE